MPNTSFKLVRKGTTTPAVIYSDENFTIANSDGTITSDANGVWEVFLDPTYAPYEVEYKGERTGELVNVPAHALESEYDDVELGSKVGGVHGVPTGEHIASQEYVQTVVASVESGGTAYVLPTASNVTKGGVQVDTTDFTMTGAILGLSSATKAILNAVAGKYVKPGSGIPLSDLASAVQTSINAIAGKYTRPSNGIPEEDLAPGVQTKLANVGAGSSGPKLIAGPASGPPTTGTFSVGDTAHDGTGREWVCTTGGVNTAAVWKTEPRTTVSDVAPTAPLTGDLWVSVTAAS